MKKNQGRVARMVVSGLLFSVAMLIVLCVFAFVLVRQQDEALAQFEPPTVFVTEPVSGETAFAGSYLSIAAAALGESPIMRVELWMDGELKETQNSSQTGGVSPFDVYFDVVISEGPHMLFVRAVDAAGITGQSVPVSVVAQPKPGPEETFLMIRTTAGDTLAELARSYGTDLKTLRQLNPDIGDQEPAAGAVVKIPMPIEVPGPDIKPAPSSVPPAVPASGPVQIPNIPMLGTASGPSLPLALFVKDIPPAAPSGLKGQVKDCKVTLVWNDNATNEMRYDVWMAGLALPARTIASLQSSASTGLAWYEFPAPQPGFFSFWVEAINLHGKQPSNIVWVAVDPKCPTSLATHLQVELLDMTVGGSHDKTYCYVSVEDAPETRFPEDDSAFVQVQAGRGNTAEQGRGGYKFSVPIPADNSLDVGGECWAWSGEDLSRLGNFGGKFGKETWDGKKRALEGGAYQIGVAIKPLGAMEGSRGIFYGGGEDPTIPVPVNVHIDESRVIAPPSDNPYLERRYLTWNWFSGWLDDPYKITGFTIYLDGIPYVTNVAADQRSRKVQIPSNHCSKSIRWQVAATTAKGQSKLSAPYEYYPGSCVKWAMVKFDKIDLYWTNDGEGWGDGKCDTLEAYYKIAVNSVSKSFGEENANQVIMKCNDYVPPYTFWSLGSALSNDSDPDRIVVPLSPGNTTVKVWTIFWDHDSWTGEDKFGVHYEIHSFTSLQNALEELGCGKSFQSKDAMHSDEASTTLYYTLTLYPNKCMPAPPQ